MEEKRSLGELPRLLRWPRGTAKRWQVLGLLAWLMVFAEGSQEHVRALRRCDDPGRQATATAQYQLLYWRGRACERTASHEGDPEVPHTSTASGHQTTQAAGGAGQEIPDVGRLREDDEAEVRTATTCLRSGPAKNRQGRAGSGRTRPASRHEGQGGGAHRFCGSRRPHGRGQCCVGRLDPMQDGFLKVALQATKTGPTLQDASARPARAPPVTDPRQTVTAVATGQPEAVVPPQTSTPTPPGLHGLAPEASARPYAGTGHAAPYTASPSGAYQKRKTSVSPRVNPYETTRLAAEGKPMPGEVPLEARLAATRALKAFHVKTVPPVEPNIGAENGKPPTAFVNDDEEDEELDKTDRPRDPGSLGMD